MTINLGKPGNMVRPAGDAQTRTFNQLMCLAVSKATTQLRVSRPHLASSHTSKTPAEHRAVTPQFLCAGGVA